MRAEKRLAELEVAAEEARTPQDVALILAEEKAIKETIGATRLDEVAHQLIRLASNPDQVRAFLNVAEEQQEGTLVFLSRILSTKRTES